MEDIKDNIQKIAHCKNVRQQVIDDAMLYIDTLERRKQIPHFEGCPLEVRVQAGSIVFEWDAIRNDDSDYRRTWIEVDGVAWEVRYVKVPKER